MKKVKIVALLVTVVALLGLLSCPSEPSQAEYCTVSFDKTGGNSANVDDIHVEKGKSLGSKYPAEPSKSGYTFEGWYDESVDPPVKYEINTKITKRLTLKAHWMGLKYTVTFNKNGGDTDAIPETIAVIVPNNTITTLPKEPTRAGYGFIGWFDTDAETGGKQLNVPVNVTSDITVYARWDGNVYTVTFNKNTTDEGSADASPKTKAVTFLATAIDALPEEPTRTGYTFTGWNTLTNGTGTSFDQTTTVSDNITVYAQWTVNTLTISYASDGGTGPAPDGPTSAAYRTNVTMPANTYTRDGYSFAGWTVSETDSVMATYAAGTNVAVTALSTAITVGNTDITLTATWTANTLTIGYSGGDGSGLPPTSPTSATYGTTVTMPDNTYNKTGYSFAGWAVSGTRSVSGIYAAGTSVAVTALSTAITSGNAGIILTATWTGNVYTVAFNKNTTDEGSADASPASKTVTVPATNIDALPAAPTRTGYTFTGWNTQADGLGTSFGGTTAISANITVYAQWTPNILFINYADGGGYGSAPTSPTSAVYGTSVTMPDNTYIRDGSYFAGWEVSGTYSVSGTHAAGASVAVTALSTGINAGNASITLTPTWTNFYTITFDKNASDATDVNPVTKTVTYPEKNIDALPREPTRTGYSFKEWNTQADGLGTSFAQSTPVSASITVYAKWTAHTLTIIYASGGGTGSAPTSPSLANYGTSVTMPANHYRKTGYTFAGWEVSGTDSVMATYAAGTSVAVTALSTGITVGDASITLTATWTANTYIVTFNKNADDATDASPSTKTVIVPATNIDALPSEPTRTGYTFVEWNTQSDGKGTTFDKTTAVSASVTVYARWTANVYTVTFDKNASDATDANPASMTVIVPAKNIDALPTEPTRTGYTFAGWKTESGTSFDKTTTVSANITVYAQWKANVYTVTFNKNNNDSGSTDASPTTKTVTSPSTTIDALPREPTRNGYTFAEWNTQANGLGTTFVQSTPVSASITVHAKWTANTLLISYDNGGGSGSAPSSPTSAAYGTNVTMPANTFTRAGYTFAGWAVSGDGSTAGTHQTNAIVAVASLSTSINSGNASITLTATWTANTYTVTFNKNAADATEANPVSKTVTAPATTIDKLPTAPTRTGYTFAGWFDTTGSGGNQFIETTAVNSDITVYAKWTANTLTIGYAGGGGKGSVPTSPTSAVYGTNVTMPNNTFTHDGYSFAGWAVSGDGSIAGTHAAGALVAVASLSTSINTGKASIILTATWTNVYTVTFNKNNNDSGSTDANPTSKTVTAPATTIDALPTAPTRTGYTFAGWNTQADGRGTAFVQATTVSANITVYAQWTTHTLSIDYADGGGTGSAPTSPSLANYGTSITMPANPYSKTGYTFTGWAVSGNGSVSGTHAAGASVAVTDLSTAINNGNARIILTATWTANTYTVTFNKNNNDSESTDANPATRTVTVPTTNIDALPSEPTRTGYAFAGWNTQVDGKGTAFVRTTTVSANITVYAQWTPNSYTITFNKNASDATEANPSSKTVTVPSTTIDILPSEPTRTGYAFAGWNTQVDGKGTAFVQSTAVSADITVYAQWTANTLSITYESGGGNGSAPTSPTSAAYGANVTMPANTYTRAGYSFAGWSVSGTGSIAGIHQTNAIVAAASLSTGINNSNATITLTATWTPNTLTIGYANGGGTGSAPTSPTSAAYGTNVTMPANTYTRDGYSFAGWAVSGDGSTAGTHQTNAIVAVASLSTSINSGNASITLTATWTVNTLSITYANGGGTGPTPPTGQTSAAYGTNVTMPANPYSKTGYTFAGWAVSGDGSVSGTYAVGEKVAVTALSTSINTGSASITLTATWTANTYTVTFNKNADDASEANPASKTVTSPSTTIDSLPTEPTRTGYTFTAWKTQTDGTGTAFDQTTAVSANITVYAQWTVNTLLITYADGGGTGSSPTSPSFANYGSTVTMPSNPYTRTGYTFAGWAVSGTDSISGTHKAGAKVAVTALSTAINNGSASITLTATWTANTYTVTFNKNNTDTGSTEANPTSKTVTVPAKNIDTLPTAPTRIGYTFAGWTNGSGTVFNEATIVSASVTVYAAWTPNTLTINYTSGGGSGSQPTSPTSAAYGTSVTMPTNTYNKTGYTFAGWAVSGTGSLPGTYAAGESIAVTALSTGINTGNTSIILTATWTNVYTVTFNKNNNDSGSTDASPTTKTINAPATTIDALPTAPTRIGYTFAGWNTQADGNGTPFIQTTTVPASITVYARWTAHTLTINYAGGDGSSGSPPISLTSAAYGTTVTLPANTYNKTGYTFAGWAVSGNGSVFGTHEAGQSVAVTALSTGINNGNASIILTATWTPNVYTVTFNKNASDATDASPVTKTVTYPTKNIDALPTAPTRSGYSFKEWNTQADGNGTAFNQTTTVSANVTVYATWTPNTYTVTFNKNNNDAGSIDASPTSKTVTVPATTIDTLPTAPTRIGYTFAGWRTDSGTSFDKATTVSANITVYAQWTPNTYTVTFNKNNNDAGSIDATPASKTVTVPATTINTLPTPPTRTGYTFAGWNTQADGNGTDFVQTTAVSANVTVYATWTPNTYTVTFNKNNNDAGSIDASPAAKTVTTPATMIDTLPTAPTRTGYTFASWNTQANGSGTAFVQTTPVSANITVYAQWTANTYTVTFNKNNTDSGSAEASPTSKTVTVPTTTINTLPTPPTRTGYTFNGWNTQVDGRGTSFDKTTTVSANVTVYAQWTANTLSINYANGGGTGSAPSSPTSAAYGTNVTMPDNTFTRDGYSFAGWAVSGTGSIAGTYQTNASVAVASLSTGINTDNASITLTAQWTANTYTVTFDKNASNATDASPTSKTVTVPATTIDALPTAPTRTGYAFAGWNTQADGRGTSFDKTTAVSANITVYAVWMANTLTINYASGGGTGSAPTSPTSAAYGTNVTMPANTYARTGYSFAGWAVSGTDAISGTYAAGVSKSVSDLSTGINTVNASITLTAQWTANTLSIKYDSGGGTGPTPPTGPTSAVYGTNVTMPANSYTRIGYTFAGWAVSGDGSVSGTHAVGKSVAVTALSSGINTGDASITLTATWTANTYTVTFDKNNPDSGSTDANPSTKTVTSPATTIDSLPTAPTRTGYTFAGWNTQSDGSGTDFNQTTTVSASITVYAQWTANTLSITYANGGGTGPTPPTGPTSAAYGTNVTMPANSYTRIGYTFAGWAVSGTGSVSGTHKAGTSVAVTDLSSGITSGNASITLTATWTANTYTVTFNKNNTDTGSTDANPTSKKVTVPATTIDSLPTAPTRTGYTFAGWNTQADETGTAFNQTTAVSANITVYAQWTANVYTVSFNKNNTDSGSTDANPVSKTVTYPATTIDALPTTPTRTGYTLASWNTQADGKGTAFNQTTVVSANITVYAQWTANTLTIGYANGDGTGSAPTSPTSAAYGTTVTMPANSYSKTGYTFAGWAVSGTGSVSGTHAAGANVAVTNLSTGINTGNAIITLTATWTANTLSINYANGGGTGSAPSSPTSAAYGSTVTMPANPYTRNGYSFAGWAVSGTDSISGTYTAGVIKSVSDLSTGINTGNASITLTATWTGNVYTVTFDKNAIDATEADPVAKTVIVPATNINTLPTAPTRTGYTFANWNTQINGSGTAFDQTTAVSASITVYAQWTPNILTIGYANGGGNGSPPTSPTSAAYGTTVTLPANTYNRTGYSFAGWAVSGPDSVSGTYEAGQSVAVTALSTGINKGNAGIILTAQWTADTYTVTFNKNASDATDANPASKTVTAPATTIESLPTAPTRTGYTLASWNTQSDGTGTAFNQTTVVSANVTVYAQWTANTLTIKYANGGGTGSAPASPTSAIYGTTVTMPANFYNKTGHTFAGWAVSGTGSVSGTHAMGTNVAVKDLSTGINSGNADITLTATWTANTLSIGYDSDGGTGPTPPTGPTSAAYGTNVTMPANSYSKTGYTFAGWAVSGVGSISGTYAQGASKAVSDLSTAINTGDASITLTATWTANTYTVTFNKNNTDSGSTDASPTSKTVTVPATAIDTLPTAPTRIGYTFASWNTQSDGSGTDFNQTTTVSANVTVYAKWTANVLTIEYANGGGSGSSPTSPSVANYGTNVTMPANSYTRTGYSFAGWAVSGTNSIPGTYGAGVIKSVSDLSTGINTGNASIILTATWTGNVYTVTFDKNASDATEADPVTKIVTLPVNTIDSLPIAPTRTGYTFANWNTQINGSGTVFSQTTTVSASITVYAQWAPNTLTIGYANGGGSGLPPTSPTSAAYGTTVTLPANTYNRTGYSFAGWAVSGLDSISGTYAAGEVVAVTALSTGINNGNAGIILTAQWTANVYTVTFNKNASDATEASPSSKTVTVPETIIDALPTAPTRTGYTFAGWNTQADGSGTAFVQTTPVSADVTVYAQWTTNKSNNANIRAVTEAGTPQAKYGLYIAGMPGISNGDPRTTASGFTSADITLFGNYTTTLAANNRSVVVITEDDKVTDVEYGIVNTADDTAPVSWNSLTRDNTNGTADTLNKRWTGTLTVGPPSSSGINRRVYVKITAESGTVQYYRYVQYVSTTAASGNNAARAELNTLTIGGVKVIENAAVVTPSTKGVFAGWWNKTAAPEFEPGSVTIPAGQAASCPVVATFYNQGASAGASVSYAKISASQWPLKEDSVLNFTSASSAGTISGNANVTNIVDGDYIVIRLNHTTTANYIACVNHYIIKVTVQPETYTVTFNKNNTDSGSADASPAAKTVTTPATMIDTLPTAPTRTGYTFANWNTQANGNGTAFTATTAVTANITVYAQWTANTLSISYDSDGGTGSSPTSPSVANYGTNVTMPANPYTKTGYTFAGWAVSGTGSLPGTYAAGANVAVTALSTAITSGNAGITLTATWTVASVTKSSNANIREVSAGASGSASAPTGTFGLYIGGIPATDNGTPGTSATSLTGTTAPAPTKNGTIGVNSTTGASGSTVVVIVEDPAVSKVEFGRNGATNDTTAPATWQNLTQTNDANTPATLTNKRWVGTLAQANTTSNWRFWVRITAEDGTTTRVYRYTATVGQTPGYGTLTSLSIGGKSLTGTALGTVAGWWNNTVAPSLAAGEVTLTSGNNVAIDAKWSVGTSGTTTYHYAIIPNTVTMPLREGDFTGTFTTGNPASINEINDGDYILLRVQYTSSNIPILGHCLIKVNCPPPTPTWNVTLGPGASYTFPKLVLGYTQQPYRTITLSNSGNQPTGNLTVSLTGTNSASFEFDSATNNTVISSLAVNGLTVGQSASLMVRPRTGLALGTYNAAINVSGGNGISASYPISVTVLNQPPSYIGITSDVHYGKNEGSSTAPHIFGSWMNTLKTHYDELDYMLFCGDIGSAWESGITFWTNVASMISLADTFVPGFVGGNIFITGNHEWQSAAGGALLDNINKSLNTPVSSYTTVKQVTDRLNIDHSEAARTNSYAIYTFGAKRTTTPSSTFQGYTPESRATLSTYLASAPTDIPIIIMAHFPLHNFTAGSTGNRNPEYGAELIDLLNQHPNVIFLWGHNHSNSDPMYRSIKDSGYSITTTSGTSSAVTKTINFLYVPAGCMRDIEYGQDAANTFNKGVVIEIDGKQLTFTYYDKDCNVLNRSGWDSIVVYDLTSTGYVKQ